MMVINACKPSTYIDIDFIQIVYVKWFKKEIRGQDQIFISTRT